MEKTRLPENCKDYCTTCREEMQGGIWTNGDGFNDGKYVGIVSGDHKPYCWNCHGQGKTPDLERQIDEAFTARGWCGFLEAWVGRCRNPKPCAKHSVQRCWKCQQPAVKNCSVAGSLVCGFPECAEHSHSTTHYSRGG